MKPIFWVFQNNSFHPTSAQHIQKYQTNTSSSAENWTSEEPTKVSWTIKKNFNAINSKNVLNVLKRKKKMFESTKLKKNSVTKNLSIWFLKNYKENVLIMVTELQPKYIIWQIQEKNNNARSLCNSTQCFDQVFRTYKKILLLNLTF